jgi:hypothetical protein
MSASEAAFASDLTRQTFNRFPEGVVWPCVGQDFGNGLQGQMTADLIRV